MMHHESPRRQRDQQLVSATSQGDGATIAIGIESAAVSVYVNALGSAYAVVLGQVLGLSSDDPRFLPVFEK